MKTQIKQTLAVCLLLVAVFLLVSCNTNKIPAEGRWADALYLNDAEFGTGSKTVTVKVIVAEREVIFTLRTDKTYLADALLEHKLIEGEEGQYGLYIKKVNGMLADYDVDKTYWGFYQNGEMMMVGISSAEISDGQSYELVLES